MTDVFERLEQATAIIDLLEVQGWLTGWGDYSNRGSGNGNLGYQSPSAIIMRDNVEQQHSSRPVLFDMDDEAYYTLIERELSCLRQSTDKKLNLWAKMIKGYYLYRQSYTQLSKSTVSKYEHGAGTNKQSHVRKVQEHLSNAERHIYNVILGVG